MQKSLLPLTVSSLATFAFLIVGCDKPAPTAETTPTPAAESAPAPQPAATTEPAAVTPPVTAGEPPAAAAPEGVPVELKDPVAVVNGEKITKDELDKALNEAAQASGIQPSELTAEQKMEGYRQILDDLITDKLITKAAVDITVSDEEVQSEIAKLRGQFPSEEEFVAQLTAVGQTPEKVATALKKLLQQRKWVESQIGDSANVTDADVAKFYEENKQEFEQPEQVKASHILFLTKPDDTEEVSNAQLAKAKEAAAKAKKGGDFSALAKEMSEEPGAKESGGDLGFFSKDRMVPEFSEAAFNLKTGDISEPVRTQFGWHVIKVEDKKEAGTSSLEEVKAQLSAYLKQDKQRKVVGDLIAKLRADAKIESTLPAPDPASPIPGNMPPAANE
jgi:peptidyl-prolyl cis-trans isomerase C